MDNIRVSVIMAVYNSDFSKLKRAVNSILNQTYSDIEFVICDNASTNGTFEFLKNIEDHRIVLMKNNENMGQTYSLNRCLNIARGEYIARMDDDDISENDRIEKQVTFLDEHPEYGIVGCNSWLIDNNGIWGESIMPEYPCKKDLLFTVTHLHPSIMVRKSELLKINGYRDLKRTRLCQDYDLYMRLYASGVRAYNIQDKLFYYNQTSQTFLKRTFKERFNEVICRYEGFRLLGLYPVGFLYLLKPLVAFFIPNNIKQRRLERKYGVNKNK